MPIERALFHKKRPGIWVRIGSVLVLLASVALLAVSLTSRFSSGSMPALFLAFVLIALSLAIGLHVQFLYLARREHRETASALNITEREYKSVFDSALDAILIFDDQSVCLDANPAALNLLGTGPDVLLSQPLERFLPAAGGFPSEKGPPVRAGEHGEARVFRPDGRRTFVEYSVRTAFLPGRHLAVLRDITGRKRAEAALWESEERFRQMANNIQEIFWMLDASNNRVLYVNPAYEAITGRSLGSVNEDPATYENLVHPEDRLRVLSRLRGSIRASQLDEEFRIVRPDGGIRWVWLRGFPVKDSGGAIERVVGTAQDITARKSAEEQMVRNLDLAEAARAEAEAFRKTSLSLTQNLSMDYVLDTLLQSLLELVPCELAQVILVEASTRLFLARQVQRGASEPGVPSAFDARDCGCFMRMLATRNSLFIPDTAADEHWGEFKGFSHLGSWMGVPLLASGAILGFLSLGDAHPQTFTPEHLRLAKSLAIPAAVAIQNARLYEQAEIFRSELEQRLLDLEQAEKVLREVRQGGENP